MHQSEFESRHLNNMNFSVYLITTQMEISGMWGTEIEVIALATLLNTPIANYYHPPGAKVPLWHHYSPLCSDADTSVCIYLHNTGNHFVIFLSCNQYVPHHVFSSALYLFSTA